MLFFYKLNGVSTVHQNLLLGNLNYKNSFLSFAATK